MIVILTTEWMIPSGTNSQSAEVLTGRLLVPEGIIHLVVSVTIIGLIPLVVDY
jgi:hypothetical protein